MKIEERKDGRYRYIVVILNKKEDSKLLDKIKRKAEEDSKKVNPSYLDGSVCPRDLKFCNNLGGVLAEESLKIYLKKLMKQKGIAGEVIEDPFTNHQDHRDIKIKIGEKIINLEVRSSFNYLTSLKNVLEGKFSLIGRYTTSYKKKEVKKDFYITVIHRYKNEEILKKIEKEVEIFIIGGASEEDFKLIGEKNKLKLKQQGAEYLIISPIKRVPDVPNLFDKVLKK